MAENVKMKQTTNEIGAGQQQTAITKLEGTNFFIKKTYIIGQETAEKMSSFSDDAFSKNCILLARPCVSPKCVNNFNKIASSRNTTIRMVKELFCNIESVIKGKLPTCLFYSKALDESTNQTLL